MDIKNSQIEKDWDRIQELGGPAKVAQLLDYDKRNGCQRVQNWRDRGVPARVKLDRPDLFPPVINQAT